MQHYVLGFAFSPNEKSVVLIKKNKPEWQKGKWNGVGGKVEDTDADTTAAMRREFYEETGVILFDWNLFATLSGPSYEVACFSVVSNLIVDVETKEEEEVEIFLTSALPPKLPNLKWLIPMALSLNKGESAKAFQVIEVH